MLRAFCTDCSLRLGKEIIVQGEHFSRDCRVNYLICPVCLRIFGHETMTNPKQGLEIWPKRDFYEAFYSARRRMAWVAR